MKVGSQLYRYTVQKPVSRFVQRWTSHESWWCWCLVFSCQWCVCRSRPSATAVSWLQKTQLFTSTSACQYLEVFLVPQILGFLLLRQQLHQFEAYSSPHKQSTTTQYNLSLPPWHRQRYPFLTQQPVCLRQSFKTTVKDWPNSMPQTPEFPWSRTSPWEIDGPTCIINKTITDQVRLRVVLRWVTSREWWNAECVFILNYRDGDGAGGWEPSKKLFVLTQELFKIAAGIASKCPCPLTSLLFFLLCHLQRRN